MQGTGSRQVWPSGTEDGATLRGSSRRLAAALQGGDLERHSVAGLSPPRDAVASRSPVEIATLSPPSIIRTGHLARSRARQHRRVAGWSWVQLATAAGFGVGLAMILLMPAYRAGDALAYYLADPAPAYAGISGEGANFLYSPVASQVIEPLRLLPWDLFAFVVRLAGVACLAFVAREFTLPILLAVPVLADNPVVMELWYGNINLILAAVAVAGLRWPALWSIALLTKVTPGIGLLWFLARREWRQLGIAAAATLVLVTVSFVVAPGAWTAWMLTLLGPHPNAPATSAWDLGPLPIRLAAAGLLVAWGARAAHAWTVIVAAWLCIPVLWPQTLAVLTPLPLMGLQALAKSGIVAGSSGFLHRGPQHGDLDEAELASPEFQLHETGLPNRERP
jgi:hypothetical protein